MMKPHLPIFPILLAFALSASAAVPVREWEKQHEIKVQQAGLQRLSLPVETLNAAKSDLSDLRMLDPAGVETPCVWERPALRAPEVRSAGSFTHTLENTATRLTLRTDFTEAIDAVTLETRAGRFLKAVQVESSTDGRQWKEIAKGVPIFRQPGGVSQFQVRFPAGVHPWLRLTVDDRRSEPEVFTGARIHAAAAAEAPDVPLHAEVSERTEDGRQTRVVLDLGAANLAVSSLDIQADDPLFMRRVSVNAPTLLRYELAEKVLTEQTIYRIAVDDRPVSEKLTVPLEVLVPSRQLVLLIRNDDNPPLRITGFRLKRRPVFLTFHARQAGAFRLLAGNRFAPAPQYDLAALLPKIGGAGAHAPSIGPVQPNPDFVAEEARPIVEERGTDLDLAPWRHRKPVQKLSRGVHQVELDLDVLARAEMDFRDLRLVRKGMQYPYILERTSLCRSHEIKAVASPDPKRPRLSRWVMELPRARLPLLELSCKTKMSLFRRHLTLYEEVRDSRGERVRRTLGQAEWVRTPRGGESLNNMRFDQTPMTDRLFLETDNGNNPPLDLYEFKVYHPVTRLIFTFRLVGDTFLYYGNPRAGRPDYDLNLVADELLSSRRLEAGFGSEETLQKPRTLPVDAEGGSTQIWFWGVLALVVVVLLAVIARLLPKEGA